MTAYRTMPLGDRNGLPERRDYAYQGTGRDMLTGHLTVYELKAGSMRQPTPDEVMRAAIQELMCEPCWDDDCERCLLGNCKCECRDEAPPEDPRCDVCGYLERGDNHKIMCGDAA